MHSDSNGNQFQNTLAASYNPEAQSLQQQPAEYDDLDGRQQIDRLSARFT